MIDDTPVMKRISTAVLSAGFVVCMLLAAPAQAAWYQVDVIVFEYLYPDLDDELWYENPGLPPRMDSIELIDQLPDPPLLVQAEEAAGTAAPAPSPVPYLQLPAAQRRLEGVYRVMRLSRDYRPLLHVAWQQPGYDQDEGRAVHLESMIIAEDRTEELPPELAEIQIREDHYRTPEPAFDGTIRIRSSRFLHVDVDFAYFPRAFTQTLLAQRQQSPNRDLLHVNDHADYVRLTESRRIKLNELHYFDHSMFGVILQVSRLEPLADE